MEIIPSVSGCHALSCIQKRFTMSRVVRGALVLFALMFLIVMAASAQDGQDPAQCPGFLPSRLAVGGNGEVLEGPQVRNNVRAEATVESLILGKINPGEPFFI